MSKLLAAVPAVIASLLVSQGALASTNPYTGQGTDVSWPQCGKSFPSGVSFGIVGVDHGRPFDPDNQYGPNTCLGTEYASAQKTQRADLYINTGYDPTYWTNHQTADCVAQMSAVQGDTAHQQAWEVGCATAWFNYYYVTGTGKNRAGYAQQGLAAPPMWWLDVETGNSWSSSDLSLNAATLQGARDELTALSGGAPVGVYSTSLQWSEIAGGTPVTGLTAIWVATGLKSSRNVSGYCTRTFDGFSRAWLVQWVGRVDYDVSCG
jgi:hypothetical protein